MKNNFQKIILISTLAILILLCFAFFFLYQEINKNNQKAEQSLLLWQIEANRRDDINYLNRSLKEINQQKMQLDTHFINGSDVVPFLNTVEQLAPLAGASAQVGSVDTNKDNTTLVVTLSSSGSFGSIYKFLTLLENSPYELNFLSMDINKTADVADKKIKNSVWTGTFKIQLLSFIP